MEDTIYEPINENENLNLPATKGDLQALEKELRTTLATKDDLKRLATKTELELLRQDMNEKFANLPTKEDFSQLLTVVDKLVGEVKTYNDERNVETHRLKRLEDWTKKASKTVNVPFEL